MNTPPATAASEFQSIESGDAPRYVNMLVYGTSGVGKTTMGATGPSPILFLDLDDGLASVRRPRPELVQELGIDTANIYCEHIRNYAELKKSLVKLARLRSNTAFPRTLVFDNLTVAQGICMQERISGDESVSIDRLPERPDWNLLLQRMRAIVRFLRGLPCNVLCIAMEQEKEGSIGPALQGAIFREIPAMFDIVSRYALSTKMADDGKGGQTIKETRYLQCHTSAAIPGQSLAVIAKNRGGWLEKFERPHFGAIIQKIYPEPENKAAG